MIYVAALAHPKSPTMRKTIFVCYGCNQTRNYALSEEMANAYLASHGDPLVTVDTEAGAVAELVGIDGGVVSGVINLESSGVEASDWRPRHDERYQEV
jgi:hypothetical protein